MSIANDAAGKDARIKSSTAEECAWSMGRKENNANYAALMDVQIMIKKEGAVKGMGHRWLDIDYLCSTEGCTKQVKRNGLCCVRKNVGHGAFVFAIWILFNRSISLVHYTTITDFKDLARSAGWWLYRQVSFALLFTPASTSNSMQNNLNDNISFIWQRTRTMN